MAPNSLPPGHDHPTWRLSGVAGTSRRRGGDGAGLGNDIFHHGSEALPHALFVAVPLARAVVPDFRLEGLHSQSSQAPM